MFDDNGNRKNVLTETKYCMLCTIFDRNTREELNLDAQPF